MSVCAATDSSGYLQVTTETDCSQFVLMNSTEFQQLQSGSLEQMRETLNLLFAFDLELFAIVELTLIMSFLTSHYGGRVVRWLGK